MDQLRQLAEALGTGTPLSEQAVRADAGRELRKGVPEVVLAETKAPDHLVAAVGALLTARGRAIVSRATGEHVALLGEAFPEALLESYGGARTLVLRLSGALQPVEGGLVGIVTAGTSDIPVAEEAAAVAREMGCRISSAYDVGVAGIHRLFGPLRTMLDDGVDVLIVAAGMDGALPSVVAGLVGVPVIGLPVSIGYGLGGQGIGALMAMLQSCAPGLVVVNVDNGVGAGATAGLIARRAAEARGELANQT